MAQKPQLKTIKRSSQLAEHLLRVAAFLGLLTYLAGFAATLLHDSIWGFSLMSLVKPRYMVTGLLVLLPVAYSELLRRAFGAFFARFAGFTSSDVSPQDYKAHKIAALFAFLLAGLVGYVFLRIVCDIVVGIYVDDMTISTTLLCFITFVALIVCLATRYAFLNRHDEVDRPFRHLALLMPPILGFIYLFTIAISLLPSIPWRLGGTHPRIVQFYLKPGEARATTRSFIAEAEEGISTPMTLLAESDTTYVIQSNKSPRSTTIEFSKDLVGGLLITLPRRPQSNQAPASAKDVENLTDDARN